METSAQLNPLKTFPPCRIFYVLSIKFITEAAIRSANAAGDMLQERKGEFGEGEEAATLNHLQNVVAMGAALSRYFWPIRPAHRERGELLRSQFKVTDTSPLKSRQLRNEIEHFDEKLDVYFSQRIVGVVIPQYIGRILRTAVFQGISFARTTQIEESLKFWAANSTSFHSSKRYSELTGWCDTHPKAFHFAVHSYVYLASALTLFLTTFRQLTFGCAGNLHRARASTRDDRHRRLHCAFAC
jgi:hypothetical protein